MIIVKKQPKEDGSRTLLDSIITSVFFKAFV